MIRRTFLVLVLAVTAMNLSVLSARADEPMKSADPAMKPEQKQAAPKQTEPETDGEKKQDGEGSKSEEKAVSQEPKMYYVKFVTTKGDIVIELDNEKAPISTKNFLAYVDKGFYNGTIFHRVIPGFMIQGGGFTPDMKQKETDKPIKNEWKNGLKNLRGTLSMARTSAPDSATSQFFLNVVDNAFLDQSRDGAAYAVFGKVVVGMDVADQIVAVPTTRSGAHGDVPKDPIIITSASRLSEADAKAEMKAAPEPAKK